MGAGRYPEAEAELKKELALSSDHIRARGALAIVYHTTGRDAESLTTLNDLLLLSPTPAGFTTAFNLLSAFGDTARARQVFAEAQRRFGKDWRPLDVHGS